MEEYSHVVQPRFEDVFRKDHELKARWNSAFFKNNNPIILELGCGRGEYSLAMARKYPDKNFIGIDIKGARIWKGAKTAAKESLKNIGFLRTRIELIESFFSKDEISEIWITFPDPQLKKRRNKKRLTGSRFLNHYKSFLKKDGIIHLKTDSRELYDYSLKLLSINELEIVSHSNDLYSEDQTNSLLSVKTFYEEIFLNEGKKICYLSFRINNKIIIEPETDEN